MAAEEKKIEPLSSEVQDVIRNLVSAIRAVKLYPSNNPICSQTIEKSSEVLIRFLETESECHVGVQKTYFTYAQTPVGKETQLNRATAQDLFAKGIREVAFSVGVTEKELADFYRILALSPEELAMRSGISSVLWERGTTHIRVTEAGLDNVITAEAEGTGETVPHAEPSGKTLDEATARKEIAVAGRRLVLGDLMTDPGGFGAGMIELAKQTADANESVDDRLFALYTEAGRKIWTDCADQSDTLFEGLAQSALSLDQSHRERLIAGKLYAELDAELENEGKADPNEQVPNALHEIVTGRFSTAGTGQQVSTLLKKSSARKTTPPAAPPSPGTLDAVPISKDLGEIARDLAEYTPEEMEALKAMSEAGMESDIIEASVRTLIFLLPEVKKSGHSTPDEGDIKLFSGVVRQLEEMQSYLLKKKDYDLAALIARSFHVPVDPAFEPKMTEAANKAASSDVLIPTINDLKNYPAGSPEYLSACSYLATAERETTEILLELLAAEADRSGREFLMALLKNLGIKNQLMVIGEHLSDKRWYFVRNIVIILGESKTDSALSFLHKVANHKDARIRR